MSSETSIESIVEELDNLINLANEGENFDEDRMDQLLRQRDEHPDYIKRITEEKLLFREQLEPFLYSSLDVTRSFVPLSVFEASSPMLIQMGLSLEVAKRLLEKKALWLTRMSETEIAKLHEADLHNRFQVHANGLDIIEVAAIYASTPDAFPNDSTGRKTAWLNGIELLLKRMLTEKNKGILPKHLKRAPVYQTMSSAIAGPMEDRESVRETNFVQDEDQLKYSHFRRKSFLEVCKKHSILSKPEFIPSGTRPSSERIFEVNPEIDATEN
jgi:hypothetical protein